MGTVRLTVDSPDQGWQDDVSIERISELLPKPQNRLWLDISDPDRAQLAKLGAEFGFHELALEDATARHQRPKCDAYDDKYYFIVVYAGRLADADTELQELQLFWGQNYLVTLHQRPLAILDDAQRRWRHGTQHSNAGMAFAVYHVLDSLVDGYMQIQDTIIERAQTLEERIFPRPDEGLLGDLFQLRKTILRLRRVLAPTRDVLNEIIRRDLPLFPESLRPYFVDIYDHLLRVLEGLDTYRDLLSAALDAYLSVVSNQLNQTVKRMTALTLIVMVPTLIAGIYGMNVTFPATGTPEGFWISMLLMVATVAAGFALARRLDWL